MLTAFLIVVMFLAGCSALGHAEHAPETAAFDLVLAVWAAFLLGRLYL